MQKTEEKRREKEGLKFSEETKKKKNPENSKQRTSKEGEKQQQKYYFETLQKLKKITRKAAVSNNGQIWRQLLFYLRQWLQYSRLCC
jgi:hypothetical protein